MRGEELFMWTEAATNGYGESEMRFQARCCVLIVA